MTKISKFDIYSEGWRTATLVRPKIAGWRMEDGERAEFVTFAIFVVNRSRSGHERYVSDNKEGKYDGQSRKDSCSV